MLKNNKLRSLLFLGIALLLPGSLLACTEPVPPKFEVVSLNVTPPEVFLDETVSITAEVKNAGEMDGSYSAVLTVNGLEREIRVVTIASGDTKTLIFELAEEKLPATYDIAVGNLSSTLLVKDKIPPAVENNEIDLNLIAAAPPAHRLKVIPVYMSTAKSCGLGSLTMLIKYDDPSIEFCDVIGCALMGPSGRRPYQVERKDHFAFFERALGMVFVPRSLGYSTINGILKGGRIDDSTVSEHREVYLVTTEENAKKIEFFNNVDEAFEFFKRVIASGYPIEVHLNTVHLIEDFAGVSSLWEGRMGWRNADQISHYMVVTGYDTNYVYLNDPEDPEKQPDLPATISNFKAAWSDIKETMEPCNAGPCWMLLLKKSEEAESIDDILRWNKWRSRETVSEIRLFSESCPDEIEQSNHWSSHMVEILVAAEMRAQYSEFLLKNGKIEAGELYKQSSELWKGLLNSPTISTDLLKIADLEEKARGLY